jgi:cyclophilin family peptidyl-prolyl cis-trans isomerase
MANKKKIEERLKAQRAKRTERLIQWAGGVILVLVLIGLIWLAIPGQSSNVLELPTEFPTLAQVPLDAPTAAEVPQAAPKQYAEYPPMVIDVTKKYLATFKMANGGEFVVELFTDKAPLTVNNFVFLARDGYYDGTTFHRVLEGFMAQGGDPSGTGRGSPGYRFEDEISDLTFDGEGILAMANSGPNTNGSQFFITYAPTPWLDGLHTIFGKVVEGMDVVKSIRLRDPNLQPDYAGDAIETITITEE